MIDLHSNLNTVLERMTAAADRSGRDVNEVTLVVVTKTRSAETVLDALQAGVQHLGENRIEELEPKRDCVSAQLPPGAPTPTWHMVGHVQGRKAGRAVAAADMIHSLDSLRLARRLEHCAAQAGRNLPVLLEVNISGEASKNGLPADRWQSDAEQWGALRELVAATVALPHLRLQGLMTMAPWVSDTDLIRSVFRSARRLMERLAAQFPSVAWQHLSMGMTDDFEIAIEEGATLVRVGRAIFGPRRVV